MNHKDQLREMILEHLKDRPRSIQQMAQESDMDGRTLKRFLIEGGDVNFSSHLRLEKYLVKLEEEDAHTNNS